MALNFLIWYWLKVDNYSTIKLQMFCKFKKNMIYETKMKNITICFYFKRK